MFSPGDSFVAYMGFVIQYLVASKDITINTLSITGRSQLDAETMVCDRRNASKIIRSVREDKKCEAL